MRVKTKQAIVCGKGKKRNVKRERRRERRFEREGKTEKAEDGRRKIDADLPVGRRLKTRRRIVIRQVFEGKYSGQRRIKVAERRRRSGKAIRCDMLLTTVLKKAFVRRYGELL